MGVRLIVRAREPGPNASASEWPYEFEQDRVLVGRGAGVDVNLPDRSISSRHCSLRVESGQRVVVIDHGSTNGTRVNGQALVAERPRALRDQDEITLGPFRIAVRLGVAVAQSTSRERTVSLARRILKETSEGSLGSPRIVVLNGPRKGTELAIPPPPARLLIGRAETNDLPLDDADASREHAELHVDLEGVVLRDLGSKNGVEVGGRRTVERRLRDRDEILIGATVLLFEDPGEVALREREAALDVEEPEPTGKLPRNDDDANDAQPQGVDAASPASASETPAPLPAREPIDPHRDPPSAPPVKPRAEAAWPKKSVSAELLVLILAGLVLAASAVGLYYLISAS